MMRTIHSSRRTPFLILCAVGLFAILSSTLSKNPVLKPFADSLGAPTDLVGLVASASTIPGILISLPAASLSDIVGRKRVLLFSAFVFASAPLLYVFVTSWWQLIPVRFYHGFATAIFVPVAEAAIAEAFPAKRAQHISLFSSATAAGRAIAPFLGGYILFTTDYGYRTLYLVAATAGISAFTIALFLLAERKSNDPQSIQARAPARWMLDGWTRTAKNRDVQLVSLIQASQYYVFGAVEFFLVGYLAEVARLDALAIGAIMGSQIITLILGRPLIGYISDRVGRRLPIILGSIVSGFALAAVPFTGDASTLLLLSVGYGLGFASVTSSTSPLACEVAASDLTGTSLGFLSTMMDVGQTLGPIVSGVILAMSLQYSALFLSLSLLLAVSTLVFALSSPRSPCTPEQPLPVTAIAR
jgi:MFS family permease